MSKYIDCSDCGRKYDCDLYIDTNGHVNIGADTCTCKTPIIDSDNIDSEELDRRYKEALDRIDENNKKYAYKDDLK